MLRYIIIRTIWIFIIIVTILSMNFVLLKFAPEFPPTTEDAKDIYYQQQLNDGYMTLRFETDSERVDALKDNTFDRCDGCYYIEEDDYYRIYEPVSIAKQY